MNNNNTAHDAVMLTSLHLSCTEPAPSRTRGSSRRLTTKRTSGSRLAIVSSNPLYSPAAYPATLWRWRSYTFPLLMVKIAVSLSCEQQNELFHTRGSWKA